MKKKTNVTIIIPALNEGEILKKTIDECLKIQMYNIDVLVVIDSKTDMHTKKVLKKSTVKSVNIGKGLGKGAAVRLSIPYIKSDYVVQIDADYQFMPHEIPLIVSPLLAGYDVTLGTRYQKGSKIESDAVSIFRLLGSYGLSLITSLFVGQRITDVMAGFKGFRTSVLRDLNPQTNHFGYEAELVIRAAKKNYKIINIPITYKKRVVGNSSVSSIKHGLLVLKTIINTAYKKA
jgi:dolichol-phosphate hexosyltransferase